MKILVVRFSSIGDIVLTTPIIRCLKKQTDAEIHFLTKSAYQSVLAANPYIDRLHTIDKDIPEIISDLKRAAFDFVVDLHHNLRTFRLKRGLNRSSAAFPKLNIEKWLLTTFGINQLPDIHIVDRYFKTVQSLGVKNDGAGLDFFIGPNDQVEVSKLHPKAISGKFLAYVIGGKFTTKKMPVDMIGVLCSKIEKPIILLGGKEDTASGKFIAEKAGSHVVNACGKLSIGQSASVINQSTKIITHDTGMMHIAAACKKPIVSIWGNTVPAFGMTPYYGDQNIDYKIIEVSGLKCRPCSKIGYNKCPKSHFRCMREIDLELVLECL
ncbi:MAG: glycosyltransferase family 9 protein [Bacteroidota bacterium]